MEELSYDNENDILYFNKGERVKDSLDFGNIFLEFSNNNEVVGVEVLNASETLSNLSGQDFDSNSLDNIQDAELKMVPDGETTFIVLKLLVPREDGAVEESINLNFSSEAVA